MMIMKKSWAVISTLYIFFLQSCASSVQASAFVHPGALNNEADFQFMSDKIRSKESPWYNEFLMLRANPHDSVNYVPHPVAIVYRGRADGHFQENYSRLYNDLAAAYALALDWRISNDNSRAEKSVQILTAWADALKAVDGTSDKYLASGIYGYQFAVIAETLRGSNALSAKDKSKIDSLLLSVFKTMNEDFLRYHNNMKADHYWANWDLSNIASLMAIGIFTDRRDLYDEAVNYYLHGNGNGSIEHAAWKTYPDGLAQWQESGRDQAHTKMGLGLAGLICQMAYKQGDPLFDAYNHRLLDAARYVARYNMGSHVPFTPYHNSDVTQISISEISRGQDRPIWALFYGYYIQKKRLYAPEISNIYKMNKTEGGGGNYGTSSGGFDQLGYGVLTFIR